MTLHLPKYVFEKNLCSFLDLLCQGNSADSVRLDFLNVKHYIPAAITLIVASIRNWEAQGKEVVLVNHQNNEAFRYLQRIDFFTALGLHYQEDFKGFAKGSCRYVCNQRNQQGSLLRHLRCAPSVDCVIFGGDPKGRWVQFAMLSCRILWLGRRGLEAPAPVKRLLGKVREVERHPALAQVELSGSSACCQCPP